MYGITINGNKIETMINGFHSFEVRGRKTVAPEIEAEQVGSRDGEIFKNKRYVGRQITVSYVLIADSAAELDHKFRQLNALLNVEQAMIIFDSEPDVFYVGTLSDIDEPQGGQIAMAGKMIFYCSDPYKYSINEYDPDFHTIAESGTDDEGNPITVYALVDNQGTYIRDESGNKIIFDSPTFGVDYDGTMPASPIITANVMSDLGYIAYINNNAQIIQLGDPEEQDTQQSVTQIDSKFTSMPAVWAASTTAKFPTTTPLYKLEGSTKIASVNGTKALTANSYGSTLTGTHGCAVSATIPNDPAGTAGSLNCKYEFRYIFKSSKSAQAGRLTFALSTTSKCLAAITLYKAKDSKSGYAYLFVNDTVKKKISFTAGTKNAFTQGTASITKFQGKFTFVIGGKTYSFTDSSIETSIVTRANIYFGREVYKKTITSSSTVTVINAQCNTMAYIGVYTAKFIANAEYSWRLVPNKFTKDDEVVVDCSSGSITVNGNDAPELGALGNDWETFKLQQGINYISCAFSAWAITPPEFAMKYRKVYL